MTHVCRQSGVRLTGLLLLGLLLWNLCAGEQKFSHEATFFTVPLTAAGLGGPYRLSRPLADARDVVDEKVHSSLLAVV